MSQTIQLKGFEQLLGRLERLEKAGAKRAMRRAMQKATAVLLKEVKAQVPVDEGLLKRAQTSKLAGRGLVIRGIVGANVAKLKEYDAAAQRPTNIDWLVEYGHVTEDGRVIPGNGFMRRAAQNASATAYATLVTVLAAEIEKEATK